MTSHPFDYRINAHVYSTPEFEAVFAEKAVYQRWLDFEAALAAAQARHGVIPAAAAREIAARAQLGAIDLDLVRRKYARSRNSVVPLLAGLRQACRGEAADFVHFGATTQDVLDTGEILALRRVLSLLYPEVRHLEKICLQLADTHRATPMVARTHGQQALPTTFGLKAVIWAAEIRRHITRIKRLWDLLDYGQLSGAVGTYAALGDQGLEIAATAMALLGLKHRPLSWHTSRDDIGELSAAFSLLVATLAKIAGEIVQLQKTEIGELSEPAPPGALSSSTMPHKRNPVICQRIVATARLVKGLTGTMLDSLAHEHERDPRNLWAEWLLIPQLCIHTGYAACAMRSVLDGLQVDTEKMRANLHGRSHLITTEWLLFQLSASLGKAGALEKLHTLTATGEKQGITLKDAVLADPEIGGLFSRRDLACLDHPEWYGGEAQRIVDLTLAEITEQRREEPRSLQLKSHGYDRHEEL